MSIGEVLAQEKVLLELRNFFRGKPFLFFGTGMSCALDERFGMTALKDALVENIKKCILTEAQNAEWGGVVSALNNGATVENALNSVNDKDLLKILTGIAGNFIAEVDKSHAFRIAKGESQWPAMRLMRKLVETLPESDPILHAVTPNYDMLFEYACDCVGITYTNGLIGGVERRQDWQAIDRALAEPNKLSYGRTIKTVYKHRKHVRLYKVHGSLNYFYHRNSFIENNAWMWNPPDYAERVMITPGLSKYETLQRYRQELLQPADAAINRATHFLFLGYGFNDSHLEQYIERKLKTQSCHGLIVTRDSNARIESLLSQSDNLWLVCRMDGGSCVHNRRYTEPLKLPESNLWDIGEFTTQILGG